MRIISPLFAVVALMIVAPASALADDTLAAILDARSDDDKARDQYRNPAETMEFFDLRPGMTVVETLPGRGWYTRILVPYLGAEGRFYGANYTLEMFERVFGARWENFRERMENWPETFPAQAAGYAAEPPETGTYTISQAPESLRGTIDRVLFIRSLHHLNRYDPSLLDNAATESFALLKPGGAVGVVQHRAPEGNSDQWANGDQGYLKQSRVIEAFEGAGFTLEAQSEINANPKDQPTESDRVWRLPPSLTFKEVDREKYLAIGESDRMTLLFSKPN
jgi:predicted methyltransferase